MSNNKDLRIELDAKDYRYAINQLSKAGIIISKENDFTFTLSFNNENDKIKALNILLNAPEKITIYETNKY